MTPEAFSAQVADNKLVNYLLKNRGKSKYFLSVGFTEAESLRSALLQHITENDYVATTQTEFGVNYVVEGFMQTPTGLSQKPIRSVWIVRKGETAPHFVTAYPIRAKRA